MDRNGGSKICRRHDHDSLALDSLICFAKRAVSARGSGKIDDDRAASHSIHSFFSDQERGGPARDLCSSNHHVGSLRAFRDQVSSALQCFFRQLHGITTCVFSFESTQIDFQKCCPERPYLLTSGSPDIVGFNDSPETSGGVDSLQSCDTGA